MDKEGEADVIEGKALSRLTVHFISLVESPANKRQFLVKQAALEDGVEVVEKTVRIVKSDTKRRVAYGIVLAPDEIDDEQDTISKEEIEKAAYAFMQAGQSCCREGSRRQQVWPSRRCPGDEDRQGG